MSLETQRLPGPGSQQEGPGRVLLVDDEELFRASAARALRSRFPHATIDTVGDGAQALDELSKRHYDVLVTDLNMPNVDGFGLLAELERQRYVGRIVVLTAFANNGFELDARNHGAVHFLEKPVQVEDLALAVSELKSSVVGGFRGLSLSGLVQLIEAEILDLHLRVVVRDPVSRAPGQTGANPDAYSGSLFFEQGRLTAAMAGPYVGSRAALELFSLGEGEYSYELHPLTGSRDHTVDHPLSHLLLEGARLADERNRREEADIDCRFEAAPAVLVPHRNVIVAPARDAAERLEDGARTLRPADEPRDYEVCFEPLLELAGVAGAAVIDLDDRRVLAHLEEPGGFDILESAAEAIVAMRAHLRALGHELLEDEPRLRSGTAEVRVTLDDRVLITRLLAGLGGVCLHVVLERRRVDVAAAHQRLLAVEQALL